MDYLVYHSFYLNSLSSGRSVSRGGREGGRKGGREGKKERRKEGKKERAASGVGFGSYGERG